MGGMFPGEIVDAFELDQERVLDEDIRNVVTDGSAFVVDDKGDLRFGIDAAQAEFDEKGAFVDLFKEPGTEGVGDVKDGAEYTLSKLI